MGMVLQLEAQPHWSAPSAADRHGLNTVPSIRVNEQRRTGKPHGSIADKASSLAISVTRSGGAVWRARLDGPLCGWVCDRDENLQQHDHTLTIWRFEGEPQRLPPGKQGLGIR
jgi:hypothetical protein